jgi:hypothetical protein
LPVTQRFAVVEALQQQGRIANGPTMDGRVIDRYTALGHHLLKIAQAQIVGKVPAYTEQNHRSVELAALEHRNPPKIIDRFFAILSVTKTLQQIRVWWKQSVTGRNVSSVRASAGCR